ncbi:MAG: hypothetical protein ACKO5R_13860 [Planctomycetaceae bacterium]
MKNIPRSGKRLRPKTAVRGKRYRCAGCHVRSPRPVKKPAPWWCPRCLAKRELAPPLPAEAPAAWRGAAYE